jgi:hypothetical protein
MLSRSSESSRNPSPAVSRDSLVSKHVDERCSLLSEHDRLATRALLKLDSIEIKVLVDGGP